MRISELLNKSKEASSRIKSYKIINHEDGYMYSNDSMDVGNFDDGISPADKEADAQQNNSNVSSDDVISKYISAGDYIKSLLSSSINRPVSINSDSDDKSLDAIDTIHGYDYKEHDFSSKFNTEISDDDYIKYLEWRNFLPDNFKSVYDYDLRGLFLDKEELDKFNKSFLSDPENAHMTDKYKKPNHPTFSNESQWHGSNGFFGGEWSKDGLEFKASNTNISLNGTRGIINYLGGRTDSGGIKASFLSDERITSESLSRYLNDIDSMVSGSIDLYLNGPEQISGDDDKYDEDAIDLMEIHKNNQLLIK